MPPMLTGPRAVVLAAIGAACTRHPAPRAAQTRAPASAPSRADAGAGDAGAGASDAGPVGPWRALAGGVRYRRARARSDDGGALDWWVVRVDLSRVVPTARAVPDDRLSALAQDPRVLLAINAGFFQPDHRPSGLLSARGVDLAQLAPAGGSGALVLRAHRAEIVAAATTPLSPAPPFDLAVQCGPRLIESDGTGGIRRDDGRRFARTAACLRDGGRTLDLVLTWEADAPLRGPSLYHLSRLLLGPSPVGDAGGCESALNLDGGPSTGLFVRGATEASHEALGPVPFALVLER